MNFTESGAGNKYFNVLICIKAVSFFCIDRRLKTSVPSVKTKSEIESNVVLSSLGA